MHRGVSAALQYSNSSRLQNPLCTGCTAGYFKQVDGSCAPCDSAQPWTLLLVCAGLGLSWWAARRCQNGGVWGTVPQSLECVMTWAPARAQVRGWRRSWVSAVATALQLMVQMSAVLEVVYPAPVRAVLEALRVPLSLDIFNAFPRECVGEAAAGQVYGATYNDSRLRTLQLLHVLFACSYAFFVARNGSRSKGIVLLFFLHIGTMFATPYLSALGGWGHGRH